MVLIRFVSVLAAASMLLTAAAEDTPTTTSIKKPITTPTTTVAASAMTSIGCFATATPLENHGEWKFQSPGNCQLVCLQEGKNVMAVSDGLNCYCGDMIPAEEWKVDNSTCDTPCAGDDTVKCTCKFYCPITANTDITQAVDQATCGLCSLAKHSTESHSSNYQAHP